MNKPLAAVHLSGPLKVQRFQHTPTRWPESPANGQWGYKGVRAWPPPDDVRKAACCLKEFKRQNPAKVGPPVGLGRLPPLRCIYSWWLVVVGAAAPLLGGLVSQDPDRWEAA